MPVNITDVDVFTDPVQAPADGDSANGVTFQLTPQHLANRTRNLKNRLDGLPAANNTWAGTNTFNGLVKLTSGYIDNSLGVDGEMLYVDGTTGTPTAVSRTVTVPLAEAAISGTGAVDVNGLSLLVEVGLTGASHAAFPLRTPRGSTIVDFHVAVANNTGGSSVVSASLVRQAPDFSAAASSTVNVVVTVSAGSMGTGTAAVLSPAPLSEVVNNETDEYHVVVYAAAGCTVRGVRLTYRDPGPRNG